MSIFSSKFVRSSQTVFCAFFLCGSLLPPAKPVITDITVTNSEVTLLFENTDGSNQFTMQKNLGLDAANWANAPDATLTALGGNQYTFAVPRTSADKQFYRILGSMITGTALDPDGDGLASAFEITFSQDPNSPLYSNPNLFDTDGDGISDGIEFAMGTQPNNPISKPDLAALPAVEFATVSTKAIEGNGSFTIPLVSSSAFTGSVTVAVSANSDVAQPDFATFSPSVAMSGGTGTLTVSFEDDLLISPTQRLVYIDIKAPSGAINYRTGGKTRHVIVLSENDGYWNGGLKGEGEIRSFRMKILQQGQTMQAFFVAGGAEDGLPKIAGETVGTETSQTEGVIPLGEHLASVSRPTPGSLMIVSPQLPVDTGSEGALGSMAGLQRRLTFTATPPVSGHIIDPRIISGSFEEKISIAGKPVSHLDRTMTGAFVIAAALPESPE